jgi:uncharacterized membrane protein YphA (DoxX/SURF4 family)
MPPIQLIRFSVALVWLYEGLWCKVLGRLPHQEAIVSDVPFFGSSRSHAFLVVLGWAELALGVWVLTGRLAWAAAMTQTIALVSMNTVGLLFARKHINDPAGMLCKNLALLVLAWVAAAHPAG